MKRILLAVSALTLTAIVIAAAPLVGARAAGITQLPETTLTDHGKPVTIHSADAPVTALIFVSTTCEVTAAYSARLEELFADYSGKKVQFVFVDSNANETTADVDTYSRARGWKFRVYQDEANRLADKLDAHVTPEVYLFDKTGTLRYHGRVDDSRPGTKITSRDTRTALDALLSGKPVPVAETKAFGCTISRVKS
ncbi:redoxin domain-containing protein [Terriglobus sp. RCC_193]|uniref:redoxin domain-containing protein n=1 Tax=Terriglobus sp. RCC_193 TaxID=3239218 RepID=UPI003524664A